METELEKYHKDCYSWALHCCKKDRDMAMDVLQTSYLKILEKQNAFREESSFKTWAFIIIRNTATDTWRKKKKWKQLFQNNSSIPDLIFEQSKENSHDKNQRELFFSQALRQLSERQQQILQLVFYHDLSLNQSADVLKISQGSARKHYDRAKKSLAVWFSKNGIEQFK